MLHSRDDNEQHDDLPSFPEDLEDVREDVPSTPDQQAELLQGNEQWAEDPVNSTRYLMLDGPRRNIQLSTYKNRKRQRRPKFIPYVS